MEIFIIILLLIIIFLILHKKVDSKIDKETETQKTEEKSVLPMWILMMFVSLVGLLFLAIKPLVDAKFLPQYQFFTGEFGELVGVLSSNLGQALFIGGLVGIFFDIGSVKRYFEERISDILIKDEYLKSQENDELMRLRSRATKNIYDKKNAEVDKKLVKLDEEICESFTKPFFEYYQESSNCILDVENKYIIKTVRTRFKIFSPTNDLIYFNDFYKPKIRFKSIDGVEDEDIRNIETFEIKVGDKGKFISLLKDLEIKSHKEDMINSDDHYKITTEIVYGDVIKDSLTFKDVVEARIVETRKIPLDDLSYSFRVDNLVQNLKISLVFEGVSAELIGNVYGTMSNPRKGIFIDRDSNSISLESKEWMLKGNGAFINIIPKKPNFGI